MTGNSAPKLSAEMRETVRDWMEIRYPEHLFDAIAAHDAALAENALGFIGQTIYANSDNSEAVVWRNDEVLELLHDIRRTLNTPQEQPPTAHDFDSVWEGCRNCAALPGEEDVCEGPPEPFTTPQERSKP